MAPERQLFGACAYFAGHVEEGLVLEFLETGQANSEDVAREMAIEYAELEVVGGWWQGLWLGPL